jgi:hypothetical protein
LFSSYFSEDSYVINPPFFGDLTNLPEPTDWLFNGDIEFEFGRQYSYNSYHGGIMDGI